MIRTALLTGACALAFASAASAETVAITNAKIETVAAAGTIASGTIVLTDGKITAVGANVSVPSGARVIDAKGGVVTPGLIAPSSNLAASEIGGVRETRDDGSGTEMSAGFDISYSINPDSPVIGLARDGGVTSAAVTPTLSGGGGGGHRDDGDIELENLKDMTAGRASDGDPRLFAGQAALIRLAAGDDDIVTKARVAVALDLGQAGARAAGGSRGAAIVLVKSAFEDARAYARNRSAFEKGATRDFGLSRIDLDALVPVVEGKTPLLVRVRRASDIRQIIKLAAEEKVKIILEGAEEGWIVAADIAKAGVPVIVDTQADLPDSFETLGSRLDNAARLQVAGVTVAITGSRDFNNLRLQRLNAGLAVANGMPYQAALASVTAVPAKMWGMSSVGTLEVGKDADVVLWNGDPLETTTWPTAVFVGGYQQPADFRGSKLRDRYARPAGAYPRAY